MVYNNYMNSSYKVGDKILVINIGVCLISDIETKDFGNGEKSYYILHPIFKNCNDRIMIPVENTKNIRDLVDKEVASRVYSNFEIYENYWVKNPRERKEYFLSLLNSGDIFKIKNLYLTLQNKKAELLNNKKLLNTTDKYVLDSVIKSLSEEISVVLELDYNETFDKLSNFYLGLI